jgi:hypothetical protein
MIQKSPLIQIYKHFTRQTEQLARYSPLKGSRAEAESIDGLLRFGVGKGGCAFRLVQ